LIEKLKEQLAARDRLIREQADVLTNYGYGGASGNETLVAESEIRPFSAIRSKIASTRERAIVDVRKRTKALERGSTRLLSPLIAPGQLPLHLHSNKLSVRPSEPRAKRKVKEGKGMDKKEKKGSQRSSGKARSTRRHAKTLTKASAVAETAAAAVTRCNENSSSSRSVWAGNTFSDDEETPLVTLMANLKSKSRAKEKNSKRHPRSKVLQRREYRPTTEERLEDERMKKIEDAMPHDEVFKKATVVTRTPALQDDGTLGLDGKARGGVQDRAFESPYMGDFGFSDKRRRPYQARRYDGARENTQRRRKKRDRKSRAQQILARASVARNVEPSNPSSGVNYDEELAREKAKKAEFRRKRREIKKKKAALRKKKRERERARWEEREKMAAKKAREREKGRARIRAREMLRQEERAREREMEWRKRVEREREQRQARHESGDPHNVDAYLQGGFGALGGIPAPRTRMPPHTVAPLRANTRAELKMSGHGVGSQGYSSPIPSFHVESSNPYRADYSPTKTSTRFNHGDEGASKRYSLTKVDRVREGQRMRALWEQQRKRRAQHARRQQVESMAIGGNALRGGVEGYGKRFS
jgi:hypothetical protein